MGESVISNIELSTSMPSIRAGRYEARFALTQNEVMEAQQLRYDVMYAEKGGRPDLKKVRDKADVDEWDDLAYHIVVIDHDKGQVVGTLRLVASNRLAKDQKFYTEQAFDVTGLRQHYPVLLELGRFCIHPEGRNGAILMLIWKYAMNFIVANPIDVMLGCASFPGTQVEDHIDILSWLYQNNRAPDALMPQPLVPHVCLKDLVQTDLGFDHSTRKILTPLLRGYLKLGALSSETAIIDPIFNTTFVAIYVDAKQMHDQNTVLLTSSRG